MSKVKTRYNFKILCNPGTDKKSNCFCNADNPGCIRGYDMINGCILIEHSFNPYEGIEECFVNTRRTYKRVNGKIKQIRGGE